MLCTAQGVRLVYVLSNSGEACWGKQNNLRGAAKFGRAFSSCVLLAMLYCVSSPQLSKDCRLLKTREL